MSFPGKGVISPINRRIASTAVSLITHHDIASFPSAFF
jgi:hypothetical protein